LPSTGDLAIVKISVRNTSSGTSDAGGSESAGSAAAKANIRAGATANPLGNLRGTDFIP
jgi:hypothetical protein